MRTGCKQTWLGGWGIHTHSIISLRLQDRTRSEGCRPALAVPCQPLLVVDSENSKSHLVSRPLGRSICQGRNTLCICLSPWVITSPYRDGRSVVCDLYSSPRPCKCTHRSAGITWWVLYFETKWWKHSWMCIILSFRTIRMLIKCWTYISVYIFQSDVNFSDFILQCRKDSPRHAYPGLFVSEGNVVDFFPLHLEILTSRICSSCRGGVAHLIGLGDAH